MKIHRLMCKICMLMVLIATNLSVSLRKKFSRHVIVRLPGLIGPGLRKNIIFDFLNHNNVTKIESRSVFQFCPMVNL